jgi:hypothetical protein
MNRSERAIERLDAALCRRLLEGEERALAAKALEEVFALQEVEARLSERRAVLVESAKQACAYCAKIVGPYAPPRDRKAGARWHSVPASNGPAGADWCKAWRIWDVIEEMPPPAKENGA